MFCEGFGIKVYMLWLIDVKALEVWRMADEIQSDGGRNLIGRRTESDRAAYGTR